MITPKNLTSKAMAQALKTAIAAIFSIYIADWFKLPQGYWAAISAIVVMQSEVAGTLQSSIDRIMGTAIGAFMGAVFVAYLGRTLPWFGVAVLITMLFCQLFGLNQAYRLACVTVVIVMLIYPGTSPWNPALHRFLEVGLGNIVAVGVAAIPLGREAGRSA